MDLFSSLPWHIRTRANGLTVVAADGREVYHATWAAGDFQQRAEVRYTAERIVFQLSLGTTERIWRYSPTRARLNLCRRLSIPAGNAVLPWEELGNGLRALITEFMDADWKRAVVRHRRRK